MTPAQRATQLITKALASVGVTRAQFIADCNANGAVDIETSVDLSPERVERVKLELCDLQWPYRLASFKTPTTFRRIAREDSLLEIEPFSMSGFEQCAEDLRKLGLAVARLEEK